MSHKQSSDGLKLFALRFPFPIVLASSEVYLDKFFFDHVFKFQPYSSLCTLWLDEKPLSNASVNVYVSRLTQLQFICLIAQKTTHGAVVLSRRISFHNFQDICTRVYTIMVKLSFL